MTSSFRPFILLDELPRATGSTETNIKVYIYVRKSSTRLRPVNRTDDRGLGRQKEEDILSLIIRRFSFARLYFTWNERSLFCH